jgi:uncharacterized membrane protein HdeD (DUF308 family)
MVATHVDSRDLKKDVGAFCRRNWWMFLIGGIASLAFGILAFFNPFIALLVLGLFFAASLLVDGAVSVWAALNHRDKDGWWLVLLLGIVSIAVGAYLLAVPPASILALVFVVSFIAIASGVALLSLGWKIRKAVAGEWVLYLTGALSLLLGILMMAFPGIGGLSVAYVIAFWAVVTGLLRIVFALRIRSLVKA